MKVLKVTIQIDAKKDLSTDDDLGIFNIFYSELEKIFIKLHNDFPESGINVKLN